MAVTKKAVTKKAAPKKAKKAAVVVGEATNTAIVAPKIPKRAKTTKSAKPEMPNEAPITSSEQIVYVVIDHPVNGELLIPGHYAIRIGASWGGIVEFQINDGEWIPCRHNAGYWWFDWHNIPAGKHKLAARLVDNNGDILKKSAIRRVEVK
jgi:hypothetical protein